jgi:hypothetical protein
VTPAHGAEFWPGSAPRPAAADLEEAGVTRSPYEIRVVGVLGPAAQEAFADLAVDVEPTATVLSGELDQSSLHAVLDRVRALGLELVDVTQAPSPLPDPTGGPSADPDPSPPIGPE